MQKNSDKTGIAEARRKNPLFALREYHYRIVELRYEGKTYKEIAGEVAMQYRKGIHPDTIRKWFARGGLLENEYMDYAAQENDRRRKLMQTELKKLVVKIPGKLEKLLDRLDTTNQPDMVVLMTVKTLIETLGINGAGEGSGNTLDDYFQKLKDATTRAHHEEPTRPIS